ncbi:MAG: DNA topoisomerase IB [Phycisphaerae bacterium]
MTADEDLLCDPELAADYAGLVYVSDDAPGITRVRRGKGWSFYLPGGRKIQDARTLQRLKALAVPPAYRGVWYCTDPLGHLQATGRDDAGRKQYRYHDRFRDVRDEAKFDHLLPFARRLPRLRRTCRRYLREPGVGREKVLSAVVVLLEKGHLRVGNEAYAKRSGAHGATTLTNGEAEVIGGRVVFSFTAKGGQDREVDVRDAKLSEVVAACQDLPGQDLFGYLDDAGQHHDVTSGDVNAFLGETAGLPITAKTFRTWAATVQCYNLLRATKTAEMAEAGGRGPEASEHYRNRLVVQSVRRVAKKLGNTPTVCRKCYVHPAVPAAFIAGDALEPGKLKAGDSKAQKRLLASERDCFGFLAGRPEQAKNTGIGQVTAGTR